MEVYSQNDATSEPSGGGRLKAASRQKTQMGSTEQAIEPASMTVKNYKNVSTRNRSTLASRASYSCTVHPNMEGEKEFPMFIAMANVCITPTGFSDVLLREAACSKIMLMCGEISMAYTSKTTHLLAAHANTAKVELARERNLPVVSIDWIENIWNACQQNNPYIHASLAQFQNYEFPIFYNLHFVFSKRYDMDSKQFYEGLVLTNGAFVGNILKKGPNYFYVCQEPESEQMYKYAQSKEITCIPLAWIIESVDRKTLAKVTEYEIRGDMPPAFGTTFDMSDFDLECLQALPEPLIPTAGNTTTKYNHSSGMDGFEILNEMDSYISQGDVTNSKTLIATELNSTIGDADINIEMEVGKTFGEGSNGSFLDDTLTAVDNNSRKENLVESLSCSLAG